MALPQALAAADVDRVTVSPTALAERVSAVGTRTAVPVPMELSAAGTESAGATAASAWRATLVPSVSSAQAVRRHARDTGEASSPVAWEQRHSGTRRATPICLLLPAV